MITNDDAAYVTLPAIYEYSLDGVQWVSGEAAYGIEGEQLWVRLRYLTGEERANALRRDLAAMLPEAARPRRSEP